MTHRELLRVVAVVVPAVALAAHQPCPAQSASAPAAIKLETRAKLGTTLLYAHRFDEAIVEFQRVLKEAPDNYEARFGLARAYYWTKQIHQASETLKPLVAQRPTAEVTALWNEIAAASGNTLTALGAMDAALKDRPADLELWASKTGLLVTAGAFGPAIRELRKLSDQHPDSLIIRMQLAHAYFTADRYPEATEIYRNLLDEPPPLGQDARVALARIQLKARFLTEAKETLQALMAADASDPRSYLGLITLSILDPEIYQPDADRFLKALGDCHLAERLDTSDSVREWMFMTLGELVSHEASDNATKLARRIAELVGNNGKSPAIQVCKQVLDQYVTDGPKAVKPDVQPYLPAIRDGSMQRSAVYNLAHLLLTLHAGEPLVEVCDAYLQIEPNDIAMMLFRAEGLATTARYTDADEGYIAILEKMPENTKARRGLARNYSWYRAFDKSYDYYKELIEQDPSDMVIRREYARALGWDKKILKSLDTYDEAIEACGNDSAGQVWKKILTTERQAKHDYWWGYDKKAAQGYQEAIAYEPANMEARFDLGQVYANNRHWEEAADQYNRILDTIDARHRRAPDALYKNSIYHEPELRVEYQWFKERGRGDLVDIETCRLTETLKQEIARRTDLSLIETQMWHHFDRFRDSTWDEYQQALRLDHRFDLQTYGHITAGHAELDGTDEQDRFIGDFELTYKALDWAGVSVGGIRQPYRKNWTTLDQGIDENKLYVRVFGNVDPWLDWYVQYGHSWLDKGEWWRTSRECLVNQRNNYDELLWGVNYRLSLFPKILQLEYHGIHWSYDHDVPTYWAPPMYTVHIFRIGWRHYLNTDQYFEQRQFYYEAGLSMSIDDEDEGGIGYDLGLGWDFCHHFGVEVKWAQTCSNVYDSRMFYILLVNRF